MMFVAGPVRECLDDGLHRPVLRLGVVLRDPDKHKGRDQSHDTAGQEPRRMHIRPVEHRVHGRRKPGQRASDEVT